MYKVVLSTDSKPIEMREKVYAPAVRNPSVKDVLENTPPEDILIIRIGDTDYEVSQYDFNQAVKPFLYDSCQM